MAAAVPPHVSAPCPECTICSNTSSQRDGNQSVDLVVLAVWLATDDVRAQQQVASLVLSGVKAHRCMLPRLTRTLNKDESVSADDASGLRSSVGTTMFMFCCCYMTTCRPLVPLDVLPQRSLFIDAFAVSCVGTSCIKFELHLPTSASSKRSLDLRPLQLDIG